MSIFEFLGRSIPRSSDQLERDVEDTFETANSAWDFEHTPTGGHAAITLDSLGPRTTDLVAVYAGLRYMAGPWAFEQILNSQPAGFGAVIRTPIITANQNDYAPAGIANGVIVEMSSDAARDLTGLAIGTEQRRFLWLVNRGNYTITLKHNSSSSSAINRFAVSGSADFALRSGGMVQLYYDLGSEIWRLEGGPVSQIKSLQTVAVTFAMGSGTTQDFTLSTPVTNYLNVVFPRCSDLTSFLFAAAHVPRLTGNSTLRITGSDGSAHSLIVDILEYQNIG